MLHNKLSKQIDKIRKKYQHKTDRENIAMHCTRLEQKGYQKHKEDLPYRRLFDSIQLGVSEGLQQLYQLEVGQTQQHARHDSIGTERENPNNLILRDEYKGVMIATEKIKCRFIYTVSQIINNTMVTTFNFISSAAYRHRYSVYRVHNFPVPTPYNV